MKKIDSQVDLIPGLTEQETLNIAQDFLKNPLLKLSLVHKIFLYSGFSPSQLIFKVEVKSETGSRILYVGHTTRSVVFDSPTSFH